MTGALNAESNDFAQKIIPINRNDADVLTYKTASEIGVACNGPGAKAHREGDRGDRHNCIACARDIVDLARMGLKPGLLTIVVDVYAVFRQRCHNTFSSEDGFQFGYSIDDL